MFNTPHPALRATLSHKGRVFLPYGLRLFYDKARKKPGIKNPSTLVGEGGPKGRVRGFLS